MNPKTTLTALAAAALAAATGFAALPALAHQHGHHAAATPNIVETAVSTGVHTTLVAAVKAAGLVDTLSSPGPFTVFAPTDTAFAKLPAGTVATLVKPENKGLLTTVAGQTLTARLSGDKIVITDAKGGTTAVTTADVATSNGVIHVTDGVFLPA